MAKTYAQLISFAAQAARGTLKDLDKLLRALIDGEHQGPVTVTSATFVFGKEHRNRTTVYDKADGVVGTLPPATGSGDRYRVFIKTTITSGAGAVKVANASDIMAGIATLAQDAGDTSVSFETASDTDTVTTNGTTTGGVKGMTIEVEDVAANLWRVHVTGAATGTEATPFAASVS